MAATQITEAIQNLPPELREIIYKHLKNYIYWKW